ncbi:MAG TPA: Mth938-like domain-containing protein [Stellaceae bacterium]|nr:Mth938-like domain-containing protein [Stellaceae bacterium]
MDVTPLIPAGRQVIESYGTTGFRVSGASYPGSILVFSERTLEWPVTSLAEAEFARFAPVLERGGIEILLLGCGRRMGLVPPELRRALRSGGIVLDAMDTGAACRTYNVLLAEERRVAAALIKIA